MDSTDADKTVLFGSIGIEIAEDEQPGGILDMPIGVGTEDQLISWARAMRSSEDFVPEGRTVKGVWVMILNTVAGRIPWEGDGPTVRIVLLEGAVSEEVLEDFEDAIPIKKMGNGMVH